MELFSPEFFAALAAIILIDLVLAGDNAIVIALAARNLPAHLQRRAVLWGTAGAIVVRAAMTVVVVALLKVPGLLLAGGLMLLWIAYRLLVPEESADAGSHGAAAGTFWGAMRTIVIADAVMGLDNVLAVAGAAHGSYLLVVLGLLISIPIVVWGSTLILKWVERFPAIVYLGAAVLAATAAKMAISEPLLRDALAAWAPAGTLAYVAAVGGVLGAALTHNHRRREARLRARLAELALITPQGSPAMQRILIPVDGSSNALHAVRHAMQRAQSEPVEVHLLNVQPPLSRHIAQFVARGARDAWHRDQAEKALAPARAMLAGHGIAFTDHFEVGGKAKTIAAEAARLGCHRIVMSTARRNTFTRWLDLSVTERVLDQATLPVEVVTGDAVPAMERYGVPAVIGAAAAVLLAATLN
jgi:YjbE family integral membrane protein